MDEDRKVNLCAAHHRTARAFQRCAASWGAFKSGRPGTSIFCSLITLRNWSRLSNPLLLVSIPFKTFSKCKNPLVPLAAKVLRILKSIILTYLIWLASIVDLISAIFFENIPLFRFNFWFSRSRCMWFWKSLDLLAYPWFIYVIFFGGLIYLLFFKITNYLMMAWSLRSLSSRIKLSSRRSTRCDWLVTILIIESRFDEIFKAAIRIKCKRNELEEVIKILVSKDAIINTLKFTVEINWALKWTKIWSISKSRN